jgi:hypothetical protein
MPAAIPVFMTGLADSLSIKDAQKTGFYVV